MQMFKDVGIWEGKRGVHILGHHSGASPALQLGNLNPGIVKSMCLVGPSIMSAKQQTEMKNEVLHAFKKPVISGQHLLATWACLASRLPVLG